MARGVRQPSNGSFTAGDAVDRVQIMGASAAWDPTAGIATTQPTAATATVAQVASSATNVTLQALNTSRKGWTLFNDSTSALFIKLGTTASATSFTVKVAAAGYYELPTTAVYTGRIDGIWVSANGNAYVTELT